jgi:hypothetical protein
MNNAVASDRKGGTEQLVEQDEGVRLRAADGNGRFEVEWDAEGRVSPNGSLVYFAHYLKTSGLMERLCRDTPLAYSSPNAPGERDVLGTVLLSILNGQTRYAHISALRNDRVSAELLGLNKVVSEDSVRRAFKRGNPGTWGKWLDQQERSTWEPLLNEPYVLDIDNTVKPLYGHQEGAEIGYNPQKPGRPSHNFHTYFIASLRLVLGVEVRAGKQHAGKHGMPGLWSILDRLPASCRPSLIRGDIGYGNEHIMLEAEERGTPYLFKLRQTTKVRTLIRILEGSSPAWADAGEGWQGAEHALKLSGWSRPRRCVLLRRPADRISRVKALPAVAHPEFAFVESVAGGPDYEYVVLVTNTAHAVVGLAQLYRDRADCENVFDEIKNQWGWAGFVTRDLARCRIMARLIALVYNWWNIFTRLAQPEQHLEAVTSRPLLLHAVGRMVTTGRRTILRLTSTHAQGDQIRTVLERIAAFFRLLDQTAEQLSVEAIWAAILSAAFSKWLKGKLLRPITVGDQFVLHLPT